MLYRGGGLGSVGFIFSFGLFGSSLVAGFAATKRLASPYCCRICLLCSMLSCTSCWNTLCRGGGFGSARFVYSCQVGQFAVFVATKRLASP